mmetsp:Transcript_49254/g.157542  ORF Transcript_49254/g.157542 Transcript_49254/m.157542 type:complete len:330 (-) Transcript_49254:8-997(-)
MFRSSSFGTASSMCFMPRRRTGVEKASCTSRTLAGCTCRGTGAVWYMRDWQSPSAPHMTFRMRGLSMMHLRMSTHDEVRTSIKRPSGRGPPRSSRLGVSASRSKAGVSRQAASASSPPWPSISPSKSATRTAPDSARLATYALTTRRSVSNSCSVGARTPVTTWLSEMMRNGHPVELWETKGQRASETEPGSLAISRKQATHARACATLSSTMMPALPLPLALLTASPLATGFPGLPCFRWSPAAPPVHGSTERLQFTALVLRRSLSKCVSKVTSSPGYKLERPSRPETCTKTSAPPPSGTMKPNPLSPTHRFTTPIGIANAEVKVATA